MNLSDLQNKEIIDISTGKRMGNIIDVIISPDGSITKLILEDKKIGRKFLSNSKEDTNLLWKQIIKIGDDIILVDSQKDLINKKYSSLA